MSGDDSAEDGEGVDGAGSSRFDAARRHEEAGRLALEARALPAGERDGFLEGAAAGDSALLDAARGILAGFGGDPGFLSDGPGRLVAGLTEGTGVASKTGGDGRGPSDGLLGRTFADYRIIRRLGAGGMGVVYEAEQLSLGRPVALKVVAPGLLGPEGLARFRREARILGRLEHPGIARVFEAGETDDGVPFFAMEIVRGRTLTDHVTSRELRAVERLELLALTCEAVGHAHARGIVHRDLKPANVLVEDTGQPKVLDFGVARDAAAPEGPAPARTLTGQIVGTLRYLSPEQAEGRPATTASDVHALGLVCHEVLAGELPLETSDLPLGEALDRIRLGSAVDIGRLERRIAVESGVGLGRDVARDVATVVAKALEADPQRRYGSAMELADDLRRCLRSEPIHARRATRVYRLRTFVRRRRGLVAATAAVFSALVGATVLSSHWGLAATRAREAAERVAYRASLAAASGDLADGDRVSAATHLAQAPPAERGWEWRWLDESARNGMAVRPLVDRMPGLTTTADGKSVFAVDREEGRPVLRRFALPTLEPEGRWPLDRRPVEVPGEGLEAAAHAVVALLQPLGVTEQAVRFVDADDGRELITLTRCDAEEIGNPGVKSPVGAFSLAGMQAMVGLVDHRGRHGACDLSTGVMGFRTPEDGRQLAFDPSGTRLAQADYLSLHVWDVATGERTWVAKDPTGSFVSVAFAADGERIYSGSHAGGGHLRAWDAATGEVLVERSVTGGLHQAWAVAAGGHRVAWAPGDGRVLIFDDSLRQRIAEIEVPTGYQLELALTPDGGTFIAAGPEAIRAFQVDAPELARAFPDGGYTYAVDFSPDGTRLVSGSWDGAVRVRDATTGRLLRTLRVPRLDAGPRVSDRVTGVDHSSDGRIIAAATFDGRLGLFDASTGEVLASRHVVSAHGTAQVDVHPDGDRIAFTRQNTWILDAGTLAPMAELEEARDVAAWSHDGRFLAAGCGHHAVVFSEDLQLRVELQGPTREHLYWISWSPDDRRILTSARDGVVRVNDSRTGELVHELSAPGAGRAFGAVMTQDGRRILSGADDGAVRSWDAETGELLVTLPAHDWYVHSLSLAPDGLRLATGSGDGTTRLWDARPPAVRAAARAAAESRDASLVAATVAGEIGVAQ